MDDLLTSLSDGLSVSNIPNNPAAPHPRFTDYKIRSKKCDQEYRRHQLLEEQKRRRDEAFNCSRATMAPSQETLEFMDCSTETKQHRTRRYNKVYKNNLMLSEWLVDVPSDLADEWVMLGCPEGRRTTVVAYQNQSTAWNKRGHCVSRFDSSLPGGSSSTDGGCTILDCIWSPGNHSYYVLDVIHWNMSLQECETEFRFFWLKSKFSELPYLSEQSPSNRYPFHLLPSVSCDSDSLTRAMSVHPMFPGDLPRIDGLLFYHKRTHYTPGVTPLVNWLKPQMMADVLGLAVHVEYQTDKKMATE